jgi:hypothetical protein
LDFVAFFPLAAAGLEVQSRVVEEDGWGVGVDCFAACGTATTAHASKTRISQTARKICPDPRRVFIVLRLSDYDRPGRSTVAFVLNLPTANMARMIPQNLFQGLLKLWENEVTGKAGLGPKLFHVGSESQ